MTLKAFGGIDFGVQRNGVYRSDGAHGEHGEECHAEAEAGDNASALVRIAEPDAMKNQLHTDSETPRPGGKIVARGLPNCEGGSAANRGLDERSSKRQVDTATRRRCGDLDHTMGDLLCAR